MQKLLSIINAIVILLVVAWNGYTGANGLNGNTVGNLSDKYFNLFTPAGYAFAIWSLIFIGLLILAGYTLKVAFSSNDEDNFVSKMSPWLIAANLFNCIWLYVWLYEYTLTSVFVMLAILVSLLAIIVKLNLNLTEKSKAFRFLVSIPLAIYAGWISVATVANISALLATYNWSPIFSETVWTVVMILIAALVNVYMVINRQLYAFGAVGIWAITAIIVRHYESNTTIVIGSVVGIVAILASMFIAAKKNTRS